MKAIAFFAKLALIALRFVVVSLVLHRDGDNAGDLFHERERLVTVGRRRAAAKGEDTELVPHGRERQQARDFQSQVMDVRDSGRHRTFIGDYDDGPFLSLPDRRRGPVIGSRHRQGRRDDIARLEDNEPHFVRLVVVQDERQRVEGDDRMQVMGENLEQLCDGFVARQGLRDRYQRVVTREVSGVTRADVGHGWKDGPLNGSWCSRWERVSSSYF